MMRIDTTRGQAGPPPFVRSPIPGSGCASSTAGEIATGCGR